MATNATNELHYYYIVLVRYPDQLLCPYCNESVLPKNFENHVSKKHGINGKTQCVWCQEVSWPSGEKYKHKKHLIACFKKYIESNRIRTNMIQFNNDEDPLLEIPSPPQSDIPFEPRPDPLADIDIRPYRLLDMTHPFPEKDFFGHQMPHPDPMVHSSLEEFLNIPVRSLPDNLPPLPITFEDDNLNLAASYVLFYLRDTHEFFHVMVKLVAEESFLEAMNQDRGRSFMLHFSCWCNGGAYQLAEYRQHRHAIVASPKNHFRRNVWPKVALPEGTRPPRPNFLCKKLNLIDTPRYLVNTMGYLSQRKSRCNFSFDQNNNKKPYQNHHFYIYKTLPVDFKLHLSLLWDGGVLDLLTETKFQNVSVARLAQGVLSHEHNGRRLQWTQKIKHFYGHEKGMVVRVARDYVPVKNARTPHFLHLAGGRKLYFRKSAEHRELDPRVWLRKQIEGGNLFYDAVEECTWIPRPKDQRALNLCKPAIDRCRDLESRLEESNREKDELARENKSLQSKLEEMRLRTQRLTDQIIQCKDDEIARLRQDVERLERENESLRKKRRIQ